MISKINKIAVIFFILLISLQSLGQVENKQFDNIFNEWNKSNEPGGAVGIIESGKLIYAKGFGIADLEHDIPITPKSIFFIGSVAKQFTAFSILLLEEQGKLKLDDEIQKFLPDFPRYQTPITINHLIHHTSGLRDLFGLLFLQGKNYLDHVSEKEAYALLKTQKSLNFNPGERQSYTNSGYFLLSIIIKIASGMTLKEFAFKNIFSPLGMKNTFYLDDNSQIVRNKAESYLKIHDKEEFQNQIRRYDLVGSAGIYTNIEDLFIWDQNFYNNKLGKATQAIIDKMLDESVLNNGQRTGYSFGLGVSYQNGIKRISHTGGHAGYTAILVRYPEKSISLIILSNRSDGNVNSLASKVTNILITNTDRNLQTDAVTHISGSPLKNKTSFKNYTGLYFNYEDLTICKTFLENDTLRLSVDGANAYKLIAVEDGKFIRNTSNGNITYALFDKTGNLYFRLRERDFSVFKKYIPVTYLPKEISQLVGTYRNSELNSTIELFIFENKLHALLNGEKVESHLISLTSDLLLNQEAGFALDIIQKGANKVKGFNLNTNNVKNLYYEKVK